MRKISFMLLWIVAICTANAQVKHLAIEIANAQKENVVFTDISSSIKEATIQTQSLDLAEHFVNPNEVYVFDYTPVKTRSNAMASPAVKLRLPIGNAYKNIELIEVPDNFYDYVVTTSSGETYPANRNIKHYRGIVEGDSTSLVALSFYNDEMSGIIATDDGNYNVGKSEQLGKHILYNDKNLKEKQEFFCDTYDDFEEVYDPEVLLAEYNAAAPVTSLKFVKIYFETEYDIYQNKRSVANVEAFVTSVFNQVSTLYYNESVLVCLSALHVWDTTDPYSATSAYPLLTQFQQQKSSINGDIGQLLTFRGNLEGQAAGTNGLHSSNVDDKLSVAMVESSFSNYPTYSYTVHIITHELGHLLGSRHTHACVWNGNNTAIDGCAPIEHNACPVPNPAYPPEGGTIMSYCHNVPGVNVVFSNGFGLQPGNVIRNSIATASGLTSVLISGADAIPLSGATFTLENSTTSKWTCSSNLQIVSSTSKSVTVKPKTSGAGWVSAVANVGIIGPTVKHEFWAGTPVITRIDGPTRTPNTGYANFRAIYDARCNPTKFEWKVNPTPGAMFGANSDVLDVAFYQTGSYQVVVRAQNAAGMGEYRTSGCNVYSASRSLVVYPNPVANTLNIKFDEGENVVNSANGQKQYDIKLYNTHGSLKPSTKSSGEQISLDVSNLSEGNYILQISDGVEISVEQIIIKR